MDNRYMIHDSRIDHVEFTGNGKRLIQEGRPIILKLIVWVILRQKAT
jgi:hypothetical protein